MKILKLGQFNYSQLKFILRPRLISIREKSHYNLIIMIRKGLKFSIITLTTSFKKYKFFQNILTSFGQFKEILILQI